MLVLNGTRCSADVLLACRASATEFVIVVCYLKTSESQRYLFVRLYAYIGLQGRAYVHVESSAVCVGLVDE